MSSQFQRSLPFWFPFKHSIFMSSKFQGRTRSSEIYLKNQRFLIPVHPKYYLPPPIEEEQHCSVCDYARRATAGNARSKSPCRVFSGRIPPPGGGFSIPQQIDPIRSLSNHRVVVTQNRCLQLKLYLDFDLLEIAIVNNLRGQVVFWTSWVGVWCQSQNQTELLYLRMIPS